MKLSDIVLLKSQLDKLSAITIRDAANHSLNEITYLTDTLKQQQQEISEAFDNFEHNLNLFKLKIKKDIEENEKHLWQESYDYYKNALTWELFEDSDNLFKIRNPYVPNLELLQSRLKLYVNWKYSAMVVRPGQESFIDDMVGFDPLYLLDVRHDLLLPALRKFPVQYQNRLRSYTIIEDFDRDILYKLPNDQFGLCLAYNYLNYRSFEMIKKYLIEVYQKLRPGGIFILTFNDCDKPNAVRLVETNQQPSYAPGYLVKSLAIGIGYEIIFTDNSDQPSTWLELKKPGQLETLKGGQTLAKIVSKPL